VNPNVVGESVRFVVADDMSMLDAPKFNVKAPLIVTKPPGLRISMPAQLVFAPRLTVLSAATVLSQRAMSLEVGTTPPTQLLVRFKLSALLALVRVAACDKNGVVRQSPTATIRLKEDFAGLSFIGLIFGFLD
jgi:hypothetical protein